MSQFMVYLKSGWNSGRNFCANPVNPALAGFENFKSSAPLLIFASNIYNAANVQRLSAPTLSVDTLL